MKYCLANEKSRLRKSESHWPRLSILVAKYSARASALHSNGSSKANAPGYVPRYDPRGDFVKNFIPLWPEKGPFSANLTEQHCLDTVVLMHQSLLSHPEKVLTRSGLAGKSNFEYLSVFVTQIQSLLEAS